MTVASAGLYASLHHSVLLRAGCPSCRPTNSVKALKGLFCHCKPLVIQDSCSWPYDKTYDTVVHGTRKYDDPRLKCHTWAVPSCDIFNLGFVIFPYPTHYRASSVNCLPNTLASVAGITVGIVFSRTKQCCTTYLIFSVSSIVPQH